MKKKYIWTIAISIILLLCAVGAGLNAIFSVTAVKVQFTALSERGREECVALQEKLETFEGDSLTLLDLDEVRAVVNEYPYFQITSLEKSYPQTVNLAISEREERFSVQGQNGYATYDAQGNLLANKSANENRSDGKANILLVGFEGKEEYFSLAIEGVSKMAEQLESPRMSLVSVTLFQPSAEEKDDYFLFTMREGVVMFVLLPKQDMQAKVSVGTAKYLALTDAERLTGTILAHDAGGDKGIVGEYKPATIG